MTPETQTEAPTDSPANAKRARKAKAPRAPKPGRRQYGEAEDGSPIVSVTEVLQHLGWKAPGLMRWAATLAAQACAEAIGAGAGHQEAIEQAKRAPFAKRDQAAEAGTMAHAMAEALVRGRDPEDALDVLAPVDIQDAARRAFDRFSAWWSGCGLALHLSEEQIVDRAAGYGGTLDLVLRDADGGLIIADIKTGKDVYLDVVAQLAGYARLMRDVRGETVTRGLVIHVPADADAEVQAVGVSAEALAAGERVFAACLEIQRAKRAVKLDKGVAA